MTQDGLLTRLALLSIRSYQRYLSPIKGFSCALRAATGGDSCSAYGYRVIQRRGVGTGLGLLRRRTRLCGDVHRQALASRNLGPRHQRGFCEPSCDCDLSGLLDTGICDLANCGCDFWGNNRKRKIEQGSSDQLAALEARVAETRRRREEEERR